jgi:hypothetical protein
VLPEFINITVSTAYLGRLRLCIGVEAPLVHGGGGDAVACGNGEVSRGYLSSEPTSASSAAQSMFSAPAQEPGTPAVVHVPAAPRAPQKGDVVNGQKVTRNMYYSKSTQDTVEYFVGPDGNKTYSPDRHVHVIHDETKGEVRVVLTDRTYPGNPHVDEVPLRGDPTAKQVDDAISKMLETLNNRPRGPQEVRWP